MTAHNRIRHFITALAVVVLLAVTCKIFVFDAVVVSSGSMEKTLRPGDFLLIDKTGYAPVGAARRLLAGTGLIFPFLAGTRAPARGEVVAFSFPPNATAAGPISGEHDAIIIKRCVATAGDTLRLDGNDLFVNGLPAVTGIGDPGDFFVNRSPRRVPREGDILTLDSAGCPLWRDLIAREGHELGTDGAGGATVDGRPAKSYTVEHTYIFVMGDNLPLSLDSRSWGFLPAGRVIGTALVVYWSLADDGSVRWDRIGTFVD